MRIAFAGTPEVAVPSLDALIAAGHEVIGVLTRTDAPAGRGRRLTPSPVARRAEELGLPILRPARVDEAVAELAALAPECCPVVAYGQLIGPAALAVPARGWVNLHFSLLPAWRGAAPVQRALMAGDTDTGVTTFRIVPALDAGPIYRTLPTPVAPDETAGDLLARLARVGAGLLVDTLADIAADLEPTPQPEVGVTFAPKVKPDDARLDLARPAADVVRLVRGCSPTPGAWATFRGERFQVLRAHATERADLPAGRLEATKRELAVGTGDAVVILDEVLAPGKRPMAGADWARGVDLGPDDRLGA